VIPEERDRTDYLVGAVSIGSSGNRVGELAGKKWPNAVWILAFRRMYLAV
jgi:hypothetical protein